MKKIKFSNKSKVFLSLGTGCITTTALFTPLLCTSCSAENDPLEEFDKQFNIDDYKVSTLKLDCESKYEDYLRYHEKITEPDIIKTKIEALRNDLDDTVKKAKNASNSATVASSAIIDSMFEDYGIKVSRRFDASINFDLEINNFRQTCTDMIVRMMNEKKIPSSTINAKIKNFNNEFGKLRTQLSEKYDDGLSILTNIKADAVALLDGVSDELDQVAAASTFKKFSERYQFEVDEEKVKSTSSLCWDNIHDKFTDGADVSDFASKVFRIYDKNTKTYKDNIKATDFADGNIIANHRIEPLWRGATDDMYNNTYTFSLEWRIVKIDNYNRYLATGDKNIYLNTVATTSFIKDKQDKDSSNVQSTRDLLNLPSDKKVYTIYNLPITAKYEQDQLKKAYGQIHLGWDDGQGGQGSMANCAYEGYFGFEGKGQQALSSSQIGAIGLTVGSAQTNSVTRLDTLKQQVKSKLTSGTDFNSLSLEEKFVDSVDLVTFSEVTNDKKHIVDNKFYAAYKNSPYADPSDSQKTYAYFDKWDSHFEGMPISKHLYDTIWVNFRRSNEEAQYYNLIRAENLRSECKKQWKADLIAQILSMGLIGGLVVFLAIPFTPRKPLYLLAIGAGLVVVACNAGTLAFSNRVYIKADDYYTNVKRWHDDNRYTTYINDRVKKDYASYLCSYDTFKSVPMSDIKPIVAYYSSLQLQEEYQNCIASQNDYDVDSKEFNKINKLLDIEFKVSLGVTLLSGGTFCFALIAAAQKFSAWRQQAANTAQVTQSMRQETTINTVEESRLSSSAEMMEDHYIRMGWKKGWDGCYYPPGFDVLPP